ncbi:MAG TPA: hypothetical protein DIC42_05565 [Holosporales bacterium]|nr:hypothetical protein [Holosporales bacterium]
MKFIKNILVLLLLFVVGQANNLFNPTPYVFILYLTAFIFIFVILTKNTLTISLFIPVVILLVIHTVHAIVFGRFNQALIASVLFTTAIIAFLKDDFIPFFISNMYWLTIISLIMVIPTMINLNYFFSIIKSIQDTLYLTSADGEGRYSANIIIYTINANDFVRNCGFMWEPGPFASLLSLAIFFELIVSNFKINKRVIVFLIALITTFSTTGYLCLLAIFIFYYTNKYSSTKMLQFVFTILFIVLLLVFSRLDFIGEKVQKALDVDEKVYNDNIDWIRQGGGGSDQSYSLGRVQGLMLNIDDFNTSPLFGIGSTDNSEMTKFYGSIHSMNGLGNALAKYGIVGIVLIFMALFKTSRYISNRFRVKSGYIIVVLYLIQTFAFTFIFSSFYVLILLLYLIGYNESKTGRTKSEKLAIV